MDCATAWLRCRCAGMDRIRPAPNLRRPSPWIAVGYASARKKRIGGLPTERLTIAAKALGLA